MKMFKSCIVLLSLLVAMVSYGAELIPPAGGGGGGVSEGDDVGFGVITSTSISSTTGSFNNISSSGQADLNEISGYDIMLQGVFGSGTSLDVSGAGTRAFFYPKKSAWRIGTVTGTGATFWDDANIGDYSFASGYNTKASGDWSYAEGWTTTASGKYSHAEGKGTTAAYDYSHAGGLNSSTGNVTAFAHGNGVSASGNAAFASGFGSIASGNQAYVEGNSSTSAGSASHAEGKDTYAGGSNTHAQGKDTFATGNQSHAGGEYTYTQGLNSFAHGNYLYIPTAGINSAIFGSYSNIAERDANPLDTPDTFKLANMDLIVDGSLYVPDGSYAQFENYSSAAPTAGDCDADAEIGRQFIDITNFKMYFCLGASRGWDSVTLTD